MRRANARTPARGILALLIATLASSPGCGTESSRTSPHLSVDLHESGHPVLLALDPFTDVDGPGQWDAEWTSILGRLYGGCDVIDVRELEADPSILRGRRQLVLTRGSFEAIDPDRLAAILHPAVLRGLSVLAEAPTDEHARTFGTRSASVERLPRTPWPLEPAGRDAQIPGLPARAPFQQAPFPQALTVVRYAPGGRPPGLPTVRQVLSGRPTIFVTSEGQGAWIALGVHLGELMAGFEAPGAETNPGDPVAVTGRAGPTREAWIEAWIEGWLGVADAIAPWPRISMSTPPAGSAGVDSDAWKRARADLRINGSFEDGILSADIATPKLDGAEFELIVPERWQSRVLVDWDAGWSPVPSRRERRFGAGELRLRIAAGTNSTLTLRYESP